VGVKYCPPARGCPPQSSRIRAIQSALKFNPQVSLRDGVKEYMTWFSATVQGSRADFGYPMRVLILGGGGMLGHKLCQVFRLRFETFATVRRRLDPNRLKDVFDGSGLSPA